MKSQCWLLLSCLWMIKLWWPHCQFQHIYACEFLQDQKSRLHDLLNNTLPKSPLVWWLAAFLCTGFQVILSSIWCGIEHWLISLKATVMVFTYGHEIAGKCWLEDNHFSHIATNSAGVVAYCLFSERLVCEGASDKSANCSLELQNSSSKDIGATNALLVFLKC